jgi:hypothetical protein
MNLTFDYVGGLLDLASESESVLRLLEVWNG